MYGVILMIWKKIYIDDVKPVLLGLIKVLPRPISKTHGIAVVGNKDIQVSPLFFTMCVLIYHVKGLMKNITSTLEIAIQCLNKGSFYQVSFI